MAVVGTPHTRAGIRILAFSAITTRSQASAISDPPATAYPRTLAMVGLVQRHSDMKSRVLGLIIR